VGVRVTVQHTVEYDMPPVDGMSDQELKMHLRGYTPEDLQSAAENTGVVVDGSDQTDVRAWVFEG
jgi:hypothetical protein